MYKRQFLGLFLIHALIELIEGNEIVVEPSTLTITNDGEIEAVVFVDEVQYSLAVDIQIRFATLVSMHPTH